VSAFDQADSVVFAVNQRIDALVFGRARLRRIRQNNRVDHVAEILDLMPGQFVAGLIGNEKALRVSQGLADADRAVKNGVIDRRLHSFEDGLFIPDVLNQYTLAGDVADDDMVVQNLDGTIRVIIGPAKVRVVHPVLIEFEAPDVKAIGDLEVTGTSLLTGYVTAPAGAEIAGIDFETHTHSGVDPGAGNSGPPNP